jgi:hypothetical protein
VKPNYTPQPKRAPRFRLGECFDCRHYGEDIDGMPVCRRFDEMIIIEDGMVMQASACTRNGETL